MAQECAEFPLAGKVLEVGVGDDDCTWDWLASAGIDDWLERGVHLGGDELRESEAGGVGEGIKGLEPRFWQGGLDGVFEPLAEAVRGGFPHADGLFRVGADLGD